MAASDRSICSLSEQFAYTKKLMEFLVAGYVLCGWHPLCKVDLTVWRYVVVQSCVRPFDARHMTAGPDGIRGQGPFCLSGVMPWTFLAGCLIQSLTAPLARRPRLH